MANTTTQASFGPELLSFLTDLRANNNREWFAANKDRYEEDLVEPALAFINAFAPRLEKISPHFRADARPSGGSLFRIYRDTRFSKDKTPYKTNLGIHFRHERSKNAYAPGFYLHIGSTSTSARTRSLPAVASGTPTPRPRPASVRRSSPTPTDGSARPAAAPSRAGSSSAGTRSSASRGGRIRSTRSSRTSGGRTSSPGPA
jgi:hypothetical protein